MCTNARLKQRTGSVHADEAANDHASGCSASAHLAVEDEGICGRHILDVVVEHIKNGLFWGLAICQRQAVVLHPVALPS